MEGGGRCAHCLAGMKSSSLAQSSSLLEMVLTEWCLFLVTRLKGMPREGIFFRDQRHYFFLVTINVGGLRDFACQHYCILVIKPLLIQQGGRHFRRTMRGGQRKELDVEAGTLFDAGTSMR